APDRKGSYSVPLGYQIAFQMFHPQLLTCQINAARNSFGRNYGTFAALRRLRSSSGRLCSMASPFATASNTKSLRW
ncbi:hypothetical protein PIB30_072671, partial [Stylosanthes scabra]|nr:hypothetical protein [Stylosanthes scabra]